MNHKMLAINIKRVWIDRVNIGFGITLYACFARECVAPVGLVWGLCAADGRRERFDVLHSYTVPWARRQGVRSAINQQIFADGANVITSWSGTVEGGTAFMRAAGYKHDQERTIWTLLPKAKGHK